MSKKRRPDTLEEWLAIAGAANAAPVDWEREKSLEREIQRPAVEYLRSIGYLVAAVPNGAMLAGDAEQRSKLMAALRKDGLQPGWPDLLVMGRFPRVGVMEAKREGGGEKLLSEAQAWCRDAIRRRGHKWWLLDGHIDAPGGAQEALRSWGWIN